MRNYKKLIEENIFAIIIGATILIATFAIGGYLLFSNNNLDVDSNAGALKGPISLYFTPNSFSTAVDASSTVNVIVKVDRPINIQGYLNSIIFDKTSIQITDIKFNIGIACAGLSDDNTTLSAVNTKGFIKICSEIQAADAVTLSNVLTNNLISITFKRLNTAASKFTFDITKDNSLYEVNSESFITKLNINSFGSASFRKVR